MEANIDSNSMRTTVVRLEEMRTCFSRLGRISGESHANSVEAGNQFLAAKETLRIGKELLSGGDSGRFGKHFDSGTELRSS